MTLLNAFLEFRKKWSDALAHPKYKTDNASVDTTRTANEKLYASAEKLTKELFNCCEEIGWPLKTYRGIEVYYRQTGGQIFVDKPQFFIRLLGVSSGAQHGMYIDYELKEKGTILVASIAFGLGDITDRTKSQGCDNIDLVDLSKLSDFHERIIDKLKESYNKTIPERWELVKKEGEMQKFGKGMLIARKYDCTKMPNEEDLRADLFFLLEVYQRAVGNKDEWNKYWKSNLNKLFGQLPEQGERPQDFEYSNDERDKIYRMDKDKNLKTEWPLTPESRKMTESPSSGRQVPKRNPKRAAGALRRANYLCEVEKSHMTFKRPNGNNYVEPHHLIPLSQYKDFKYNVDMLENIVSLCSHCHNLLHYGCFEDKKKILKDLFDARKDALAKCGLEITLEKLEKYYKKNSMGRLKNRSHQ